MRCLILLEVVCDRCFFWFAQIINPTLRLQV